MKAYIGIVTADEGTLIGGGKRHASAAFESRLDAESWLETIVKSNRQANRCIESARIAEITTSRPVIPPSYLNLFKD